MGWFAKIFICGRGVSSSGKLKRNTISGLTDGGLVSEITQVGEAEPGQSEFQPENEQLSKITHNYIRILVRKREGDKLGIRLNRRTVDIHSFERDSPLWTFSNEIPVGSSICNINGLVPNVDTIRKLLRDCRPLSSVLISFTRPKIPVGITTTTTTSSVVAVPTIQLPLATAAPPTQRHGSSRFSHSSNSSINGYSPTPSQLSTMWRRVSEAGSNLDMQAAAALMLPPPSVTPECGGVTPIDFDRLTKDSMGMWTRNGRGGSLGQPTNDTTPKPNGVGEDNPMRQYLTYEEDIGESPLSQRRREHKQQHTGVQDTPITRTSVTTPIQFDNSATTPVQSAAQG